jgi:putative nucleotidyltransferase with HDIG domain
MPGLNSKRGSRERQLREQRTRTRFVWNQVLRRFGSWSTAIGLLLILGSVAIALAIDESLDYAVGQRISQPVYAKVAFQIPDPKRTQADREAARAKVPSHYESNEPALTSGRIRADLMRLYQTASEKPTYEEYLQALENLKGTPDRTGYERFRELADRGEDGLRQFQELIDKLPLEDQSIVGELAREDRVPPSTENYFFLNARGEGDFKRPLEVLYEEQVSQKNKKAMEGVAGHVARKASDLRLRQTIEIVVLDVFREQPTILYNKERTASAMKKAEESTPEAMTAFEANKPFIHPGPLDAEEYELLLAHQNAYERFLREDRTTLADALRQEWSLKRAGLSLAIAVIALGLLAYVRMYEPRLLSSLGQGVRLVAVVLGTLVIARVLDMNWPQYPELALVPFVAACGTLAIAFPRRFAIGVMVFVAIMLRTMLDMHLSVLLVLMAGIVVVTWQLAEIRSRSKLLVTGLNTGVVTAFMSASVSLWDGQHWDFLVRHAAWAGGSALLGAFILQGLLPFLERGFRVATSLTLLEWRDPTRPLLQLLAREAPGTYNHSLVLGTLAEAACERIGANGLLAQVGALYHDIGKIHRAAYFTENQEGHISRHENLAPTMSLLIILGHVKDGLELARQYRLPPVLHQFIAEHHGTTLVRYFHHRAVENQPRVATGRHDRDVAEADFRYEGPKPRLRESAVLMLCDAVEGAVRALHETTVGRIESTVHQIIVDRLNDGQFDDCAITMRDIRLVEDSLVKSLCGIHHGRVAYPKAGKDDEPLRQAVGASV